MTDEQIRQYMKDKIPQLGAEDQVSNATAKKGEGSSENDAGDLARHLEIAFLEDVANHPDSGVAARYTRLGLSGRQGQKLKTKLLEQGLIEEQLETTRTGKLMVVRVTEEGEQMLSQAKKGA